LPKSVSFTAPPTLSRILSTFTSLIISEIERNKDKKEKKKEKENE
jgi:hypothetical protein